MWGWNYHHTFDPVKQSELPQRGPPRRGTPTEQIARRPGATPDTTKGRLFTVEVAQWLMLRFDTLTLELKHHHRHPNGVVVAECRAYPTNFATLTRRAADGPIPGLGIAAT